MFRFLFLFVFILLLSSCAEKNSQETQTQEEIKTETIVAPKKANLPKVDTNLINDTNAVRKLMAYGAKNQETIVKLYTTKGLITIRLFTDTPLHRANFLMLAKAGYFKGTVFMRVVKDFMAQTGAPYTAVHTDLLRSIGNYTIPAEFSANHFHKRGAVAAAREYNGNPAKRSSPTMFYMVEGVRFGAENLDKYELKTGRKFTSAQRTYYLNNPGAAHLDGEHTVFGEIISGFEVIPVINAVATDTKDWPVDDIFIDSVQIMR